MSGSDQLLVGCASVRWNAVTDRVFIRDLAWQQRDCLSYWNDPFVKKPGWGFPKWLELPIKNNYQLLTYGTEEQEKRRRLRRKHVCESGLRCQLIGACELGV